MTAAEKTRLLAERVMGWRLIDGGMCAVVYAKDGMIETTRDLGKSWSPLTNLAHAGEVLEAMRKKGWKYSIADNGHGTHLAVLYRDTFTSELAESESLPTAICHAALMTEGVKEEEL